MIKNFKQRALKVGDALSQLFNVLLFPNINDTNANESISGRCYRCKWKLMKIIDLIASPFERNHCELSYLKDYERAEALLYRNSFEDKP